MPQIMHFYSVKFLDWKSGGVKFWTAVMSLYWTVWIGQSSIFYGHENCYCSVHLQKYLFLINAFWHGFNRYERGDQVWFINFLPISFSGPSALIAHVSNHYLTWRTRPMAPSGASHSSASFQHKHIGYDLVFHILMHDCHTRSPAFSWNYQSGSCPRPFWVYQLHFLLSSLSIFLHWFLPGLLP